MKRVVCALILITAVVIIPLIILPSCSIGKITIPETSADPSVTARNALSENDADKQEGVFETPSEPSASITETQTAKQPADGVSAGSDADGQGDQTTPKPRKNSGGNTAFKILFVGNSYTLDSIAYTPFILRHILPTTDVTVGATYYGGATIRQYVNFFYNDSHVLVYDKCRSDSSHWEDRRYETTLRDAIADEDWDVVCFNQASLYVKKTDSDYSMENDLMRAVADCHGQLYHKELTFGWLMPQLRWKTHETIRYEDLVGYVKGVLEQTPASFMIPCGTAIESARAIPSIDSLGEAVYPEESDGYGHLTYDTNGHLQDGLPVLISSYTSALVIAQIMGKPYMRVSNENTYPDADWLTEHAVPGQHGSPVGLSDENCRLAKALAAAALAQPYAASAISVQTEPDATTWLSSDTK